MKLFILEILTVTACFFSVALSGMYIMSITNFLAGALWVAFVLISFVLFGSESVKEERKEYDDYDGYQ